MTGARAGLILDRDGVINIDKAYVYRQEDFEWVDGAIDTIKWLRSIGYHVFIVTNQSGIAKAYYTEEDMHKLHNWMLAEMKIAGAHIDQIYYCPYHAEGTIEKYRLDSDLRKPKPGMLLKAFEEWPIIKDGSFMIGDNPTDVAAAEAAGIKGYLFKDKNLLTFTKNLVKEMGIG